MESGTIQSVEFVDTICLDEGIILNEGNATITTIDGESVPVTFIVSQPLKEDDTSDKTDKECISLDDCHMNGDIKDGENGEVSISVLEDPSAFTVHFPSIIKQEDSSYLLSGHDEGMILEEKHLGDVSDHEDAQPVVELSDPIDKLEDFMDVVTTYKCKFCRFSCPWKSGLMSHVRCCHIKEKEALKADNEVKAEVSAVDNIPTDTFTIKTYSADQPLATSVSKDQPPTDQSDSAPEEADIVEKDEEAASSSSRLAEVEAEEVSNSSLDSPVQEKHIFLCGQCSDGFASLEDCKQHMIVDHQLKLPEITEEPTEKVVRKRGRPRTRQPKEEKSPAKKRVKKVATPKESKKRKSQYMSLEDELDCCIKRKLRSGYVNDRAFRCTKTGCGHRFTSESNLSYHLTSHSGSSEKPFTCQECNEGSQHWRALAMHLWRDHTIDIDLYACTECDYKAFSFFKVDNHRKIHSDERPYMCEQCGKSFKQISQLRNHVVIHLDRKNLPEKRWYSEQQCKTCGRMFSDTKCLRKHEQAVHSRLKPFACTFCGHLSARKAMLELHMRQHTGEKPYVCEHCDYRTGDHNSLRRHRMRHTGDKPYKCPHCPYACIQAISYKTHLRNKHPGMGGLYSCALCTFKTVSKENFLHHMEDHKRHSDLNKGETTSNDNIPPPPETTTTNDTPPVQQMQLNDNALQQLEGILPGNITAAQLIYSCLNAISQDGSAQVSLPPGVTLNLPSSAITNSDGTQTITIQVPSGQENSEGEPYYFTIQQQDGTTAVVVPNDTIEDPQMVPIADQGIPDSLQGTEGQEMDMMADSGQMEMEGPLC